MPLRGPGSASHLLSYRILLFSEIQVHREILVEFVFQSGILDLYSFSMAFTRKRYYAVLLLFTGL